MADTILHPRTSLVAPQADERPEPPARRPRGPVLLGDLSAQICGRPVFLMHWDDPDP